MLSFMKDEHGKPKTGNSGDSFDVETNDLDSLPVNDQDFMRTAEHGKNLRHSTIILAVLFTVGAACLWFMIKKVAPQSADAAVNTGEARIEDVLKKLRDAQLEMSDSMNDIGRFYQFSEVEQIRVSELKKNPFEHEISLGDFQNLGSSAEAMARDEILRRAALLQLEGTMGSQQGACCMISRKMFYVGDTVDGFKVTQIGPRFVVLESEGIPVTLKMSK